MNDLTNEAYPLAAEILRDAGWKPHDTWGVFTQGTLVMGSPRVGEFRIKNIAHSPDGPDTPDDPVAAALWLVAHEPVAVASEPEETPAHEDDAETGEDDANGSSNAKDAPQSSETLENAGESDLRSDDEADDSFESDDAFGEGGSGSALLGEPSLDLGAEILDADFYEPTGPLIEGADFAETEDHAGGAFIFGDNLEQQRTSAIGLVVQAALIRMPAAIDYARMSELRNFTMGVSEGRWPDDPDKREELDTLEATERLRRAVEAARDTKVAALLSATREEIEAFDVEAGWP